MRSHKKLSNQAHRLLFVLTLSACGKVSSTCTVPPTGLTYWWSGDQLINNQISDLVASNLGYATNVSIGAGRLSNALYFGSYGSQISSPETSNLSFSSGLTVSAWVKGNSSSIIPRGQTIASKGNRSSNMTVSQISAFNPSTVLSGTYGYQSGIVVGRYLYSMVGTRVLRFDRQSGESFANSTSSSWKVFDLSTLNPSATGASPVYDGRYIYFGTTLLARYDTFSTEAFDQATSQSWKFFDVTTLNSVIKLGGKFFDGRYIYGTPTATAANGWVGRYDTQSQESFSSATAASWKFFNMSVLNSGAAKSYVTPVSDGRYLYLGPTANLGGVPFGLVARYDLQSTEAFDQATSASWSFFDLTTLNSAATAKCPLSLSPQRFPPMGDLSQA